VSLDGCQLTVRPTGGSASNNFSLQIHGLNRKRTFPKADFIVISDPDPEPAPDPALLVGNFQETDKNMFFSKFFCLFFTESVPIYLHQPSSKQIIKNSQYSL